MNFKQKLKFPLSSVREHQIKKILKYAKDILGLKVKFSSAKEMGLNAGGYIPPFETDDNNGEIEICSEYRSLTTIYVLLHEIGHHIDYLKRGIVKEEEEAYDFYPVCEEQAPCPEKYAKLIRHTEEQAIKYARELALYLDLRLPEYSTLKDEILTREVMELFLKKGFTTRRDIVRIKKLAATKAKEIFNANGTKSCRDK